MTLLPGLVVTLAGEPHEIRHGSLPPGLWHRGTRSRVGEGVEAPEKGRDSKILAALDWPDNVHLREGRHACY